MENYTEAFHNCPSYYNTFVSMAERALVFTAVREMYIRQMALGKVQVGWSRVAEGRYG